MFLAFGFTGKEADAWKWKYIDAFNRMERLVYEKNTAAYQIADQEENHQKSRDGCYQGICGICQSAGKHSRRSLLQQLYQTGI